MITRNNIKNNNLKYNQTHTNNIKNKISIKKDENKNIKRGKMKIFYLIIINNAKLLFLIITCNLLQEYYYYYR